MSTRIPVTIVWVPGAWHSPRAFRRLGDILSKSGYENVYVDHPSVGPPTGIEDPAVDVKNLRDILLKLISLEKDLIVVCHSYGGMVTTCATEGLGKKDRASQGEKGGILHLVYISAFALPKGISLLNSLDNKPLEWWDVREDGLMVTSKLTKERFYADCTLEDQEYYMKELRPHSFNTFKLEVSYEAYKYIPSSFLVCDDDQAIPKKDQENMISQAGDGVFQIVAHIKASHSPFISRPKGTAAFIERVAKQSLV